MSKTKPTTKRKSRAPRDPETLLSPTRTLRGSVRAKLKVQDIQSAFLKSGLRISEAQALDQLLFGAGQTIGGKLTITVGGDPVGGES